MFESGSFKFRQFSCHLWDLAIQKNGCAHSYLGVCAWDDLHCASCRNNTTGIRENLPFRMQREKTKETNLTCILTLSHSVQVIIKIYSLQIHYQGLFRLSWRVGNMKNFVTHYTDNSWKEEIHELSNISHRPSTESPRRGHKNWTENIGPSCYFPELPENLFWHQLVLVPRWEVHHGFHTETLHIFIIVKNNTDKAGTCVVGQSWWETTQKTYI